MPHRGRTAACGGCGREADAFGVCPARRRGPAAADRTGEPALRESPRVEALRELLAHEQLDGAVELALEARRGLLARLAEALVEREHRDLGVTLDLALRHPLEPVRLAALPLDERDVEPRADVRLGLLDRVGHRRLPRAEALGDLLDRASSLERLGLELVESLGDGLPGRALELLAEAQHGLLLLVGRRAELRRLRLEAGLDVGDRLAVPLLEPRELRLEVALRPVEVLREAAEPLLEPALGPGELLDEPLGRPALAGLERRPALLREPALLGGEQRRGLGALPREHAADLLGVRRRLGGDGLADGRRASSTSWSDAVAAARARRSASPRADRDDTRHERDTRRGSRPTLASMVVAARQKAAN